MEANVPHCAVTPKTGETARGALIAIRDKMAAGGSTAQQET
jgi:hypothetical protein